MADMLRLDPVVVVEERNWRYRAVRTAAARVVAEARKQANNNKKQQ
ncbi:hypothetical protein SEA_CHIPPER1996_21 [Arthrobacter phage Chipper1996]|uniref:Uncharacterized protein n=4 Tax=Klausavirus princesstrina TaxID=1984784 RepID=A0A1J0GRL3_9CAUD|nr:hypothetical protein SEA_CONBOY_21 [Arthrobacter phage Conboy]APC44705.1 hypothetical protein SEA_EDGARPOE_21 [Arthrobacter phage EdgarPoe]QBP30392.1 hypothetical protein SEA_CHIPPER1996_21 [Arthrobacter phage Chipper1996]